MHKPDLPSTLYLAAPAECSEGSRCIYGFTYIIWMGRLEKMTRTGLGKMYVLWKGNLDNCNKRCSGFLRAAQSLRDLAAGLKNIFTSKYNVFCFSQDISITDNHKHLFSSLYPSSCQLTSVRRVLYILISFLNNKEKKEGQQSWMREDLNTKIFNI